MVMVFNGRPTAHIQITDGVKSLQIMLEEVEGGGGQMKPTGCSLNIVFFLQIFWIFWTLPVLLQRWCSTCLACVVYTHWHREKTESGIFWKNRKKTTIFNEHPVLHCLGADMCGPTILASWTNNWWAIKSVQGIPYFSPVNLIGQRLSENPVAKSQSENKVTKKFRD